MTTTAAPRPAGPKQKLPAGLHWSEVWLNDSDKKVDGLPGVEVPVDSKMHIAGRLWACPAQVCAHTLWTFDGEDQGEARYCPKHGARLVSAPLSADDKDPVSGAQGRVRAWARRVYEQRRDQALTVAKARLSEAQKAVADATGRTVADMAGHAPSLAAAGVVLVGGSAVVWQVGPGFAAAVGGALATAGAVAAYVVAYVVAKMRARARAQRIGAAFDLRGKTGRKVRARARHVASGVAAAGAWLILAAAAGADPTTLRGCLTLLLGCMLAWAVNRTHWEELWADRRRLRELAKAKATKVAECAAAEVEELSATTAEVVDPDDPLEVGRRMAARWAAIATSDTVPFGFPMRRTRIVVEETREITVPDGDGVTRIGWEYIIAADPGALVSRPGMASPLVSARDWLASVLEVDPSTLSLVDRPDGQINRGLMMLTDRLPLGNIVEYKGRAGIRRGSDGSLYGHVGRTLLGDDAERTLWVPGQAGGGGRYGVTGSGKTVVTQLSLLNDLYAEIFPMLHDGKNLMDFSEFVGVIPLGCTVEHRDVMYRSYRAEMERRQQSLTLMEERDRHGRLAPVDALWNVERDGPPQRWTIEEFHLNARDQAFITAVTELVRLLRSSASMVEIATQGGGLADAGDSVLRDQLNQVAMQIMRMADPSARLTGYKGDYMPSELPRLPGMMLMVEADAPAVPVRSAYVHRRDEDGSIYDHLYAPDGTQILHPPTLPPETVAVYEREGLMDLWRMGQGPGGKRRLLSETLQGRSGAVDPVPTDGVPKLAAADVILAIVNLNPGCRRSMVDTSDAWLQRVAGGKFPATSTITRAAATLEEEGLLTRVDNRWNVTEKGREHAELMAIALLAGGPAKVATPHTDPLPALDTSAAAIERAVEMQVETARLVAEQQ